jgi:hypothetical protein
VQAFRAPSDDVLVRLSACRTDWVARQNRWAEIDGWDTMQRIKNECGYGDFDAVEVYPRDADLVNVANMRHLWVLKRPLGFAWRSGSNTE